MRGKQRQPRREVQQGRLLPDRLSDQFHHLLEREFIRSDCIPNIILFFIHGFHRELRQVIHVDGGEAIRSVTG